mgnify:FL=1
MRMTETVKQLVIINVIFYIGANTIAPAAYDYLALHYPLNDGFRWWQPLTHMFMHAELFPKSESQGLGIMHIFFNMFGLIMFGSALEHFWGWKRFLFFYISSGLGAVLLHVGMTYYEIHSLMSQLTDLNLSEVDVNYLLSTNHYQHFNTEGKIVAGQLNDILERVNASQEQYNIISRAAAEFQSTAVGASGALYGILVAFAFMFPNAELMMIFIPIPIKAKYFVPAIVAFDLFMGIQGGSIFGGGGGIAHFAHVGGAVTGFLMMWIWKNNKFNHKRWD